jgi:hypothetical protein
MLLFREKKYFEMLLANVQITRKGKTAFGQSEQTRKPSKSLKNLRNVREQIRKQERVKKDIQKAAKVNPKSALDVKLKQEIQKAFEKLRGHKVHDDIGLLKRAEKRILRKKKKSAENWEKRKEDLKQGQMDRQQKRKENIAMYRGSKKESKSTPIATGKNEAPSKMSRKMRRHANLMKYGPKKTREDREKNRKEFRKTQKKNRPNKPRKSK